MDFNRRDFLKAGFVSIAAGIGVPSVFARAALAAELEKAHGAPMGAYSRKTIVILQLSGGFDSIDFVVPLGVATPSTGFGYDYYHPAAQGVNRRTQIEAQSPSYLPVTFTGAVTGTPSAPRPTVAYNSLNTYSTRINDRLWLNPAMQRTAALFAAGKVAVINNVGYQNSNLSHFRAMDIWQSGRPDTVEYTGWLGRYFNSYIDPDHAIKALVNGSSIPMALRGGTPTTAWTGFSPGIVPYVPPALNSISSYQIANDGSASTTNVSERTARQAALLASYSGYTATAPFAALLSATASDASTSSVQVQSSGYTATNTNGYAQRVVYPTTSLANGFKVLAQIITSGLGARVLHINQGGYDTHSNQRTAIFNDGAGVNYETSGGLLKTLDDALAAFYADLDAWGWGNDVIVLTWSEFGRRLASNSSNGTDHGKATVMLAMGGGVRGGVYGGNPSFDSVGTTPTIGTPGVDSNGDFRPGVDFRTVYATAIEQWLLTDSRQILSPTGASFYDPTNMGYIGASPPTAAVGPRYLPAVFRTISPGW